MSASMNSDTIMNHPETDDGYTLLLRLSAPWQSWGVDTRMDVRGTGIMPTKSGVIGLVCAAMGIGREDGSASADGITMPDLAALRFGVRADQPGVREMDYQISAQHIRRDYGREPSMSKGHGEETPFLTRRWYLADAVFLVGLHGGRGTLESIAQALQDPVWPLYMGRKSCPMTGVLDDDPIIRISRAPLAEALKREPWLAKPWWRRTHSPEALPMIVDDPEGDGAESFRDAPLSFSKSYRRFGRRYVKTESVPVPGSDDGLRNDDDRIMGFASRQQGEGKA